MNGVPQTPGGILPGMHMYLFPVLQPKHPISAGYAFFRIRELTTGSNRVLAGIAPNTFICKEWFVIVLIATITMEGAAPCRTQTGLLDARRRSPCAAGFLGLSCRLISGGGNHSRRSFPSVSFLNQEVCLSSTRQSMDRAPSLFRGRHLNVNANRRFKPRQNWSTLLA